MKYQRNLMINIIGGNKKNIKIDVPLFNVRPTSILKRKSIFSILENYEIKLKNNLLHNTVILDLFSGSGSLGLEALSRGSKYAYFIEKNEKIIKTLKENCRKISNLENYEIIKSNVYEEKFLNINKKISLIFMDPPYNDKLIKLILVNIYKSKILKKNGIIVIEAAKKNKFEIPNFYYNLKKNVYKKTIIYFLKIK
tara:strand:+ start:14727 stop:15314 length:588 start_codon:yes stop_codon:yes gene_type:complete